MGAAAGNRLSSRHPSLTGVSIGICVLVAGLAETLLRWYAMPWPSSGIEVISSWWEYTPYVSSEETAHLIGTFLIIPATSAACVLVRHRPLSALCIVWGVLLAHALLGASVLAMELSFGYIFFNLGRYGSRRTVILSGVSILLSALASTLFIRPDTWVWTLPITMEQDVYRNDRLLLIVPFLAVLLITGAPWGIAQLSRTDAERDASKRALNAARSELAEATEIARLRSEQARLARDVHDVVGHSLTVVIAQAESARFSDDIPEDVSATLARIADTARASLQDVRAVLLSSSPDSAKVSGRVGDLDELTDSVRSAGHTLRTTVRGTPCALPNDIDGIAYRTLQEMLTNAIRHGQNGGEITVEQDWTNYLRLTVGNVRRTRTHPASSGSGISSMRKRLESIGGWLDIVDGETVFMATAHLPLQATTEVPVLEVLA